MNKHILAITLASTLALTTGCSAVHTAVAKRNLDVQTKMSETIFLEPVSPSEKTVYLQIKNTSNQDLLVDSKVAQSITAKGYRVISNPDDAHYWIQANVLKVEKMDLRAAQSALEGGWGAGAFGAAAGASAIGYNSSSTGAAVGAGLVGALVGVAADAMIEDTSYTMITDLQIAERVPNGVTVVTNDRTKLKQGTSGFKEQSSTQSGSRQKFQTRIVSTANQVNLEFTDAKPVLEEQLAKSISGLM